MSKNYTIPANTDWITLADLMGEDYDSTQYYVIHVNEIINGLLQYTCRLDMPTNEDIGQQFSNFSTIKVGTNVGDYTFLKATDTPIDIEVFVGSEETGGGGGSFDYEKAANAAMPSAKYIDLTMGASGSEYTAPAAGYFFANGCLGATGRYISVSNKDTGLDFIGLAATNYNYVSVVATCQKGHTVRINTDNASAIQTPNGILRFYYAEGSK